MLKRNKKPTRTWTAEQVIRMVAGSVIAGCVAVSVYALTTLSVSRFFAVLGAGLLLAGAALMAGALLGFLFGIPRSLQQSIPEASAGTRSPGDSEKGRAIYGANTSLEQISDWLTKILVGVGLTQLVRLPMAIESFSDYVARALGDMPGANLFAGAGALYFSICGFLISYLWTRLNLGRAFTEAEFRELEHKVANWERQVKANMNALENVQRQLTPGQPSPSEDELAEAITAADDLYVSYISELADKTRRESRLHEKKTLERTIPVFRALIKRRPIFENYFLLGATLFDKEPRDLKGCEENVSRAIDMRGPWEEYGHWGPEIVRALCRIRMDGMAERGERTTDERLKEEIARDLRVLRVKPLNTLDLEGRELIDKWMKLNDVSIKHRS